MDFFLHLDQYLPQLIAEYQTPTYFILCLIIFCETGLVFTPFLPGDSLLFAIGAVVAQTGSLHLGLLMVLLFCSAILGDNVNYFAGKFIGMKLFEKTKMSRFLQKKHLERTHTFYEKNGGKTIVLARFIPIIRTFAPFVAGIGNMSYKKYLFFCVIGGSFWIASLTLLGYYFGNLPIIKDNFQILVLSIIALSVLPALIHVLRSKKKAVE